MKIIGICDRVITYSFYLLFFLVPLILTPLNYELFEYNKMMLVYALTTLIVGAWLIKMITSRQIIFQRTPFDIPITLFFLSQVLSSWFSIDPHVSLFGYYSRFHGGLLSTLSYILLYYALVSNINRDQVIKFLKISLLSALVVSIYGILEHFGIDKDIWVQDVQNRVFSTLGQPNWLAAWLAALLPLAMAFALIENIKKQRANIQIKNQKYLNFTLYFYYLLSAIYYLCLLYTKSRSGFAGLWIGLIVFSLIIIFYQLKIRGAIIRAQKFPKSTQNQATALFCVNQFKPIILAFLMFGVLTFLEGAPFSQINRFTAQELFQQKPPAATQTTGPALEIGGTESGEIRKIVWKGALDIARHYPLFGTGVETFAFAYYQFRPKEHNLVSEWDFLYNKAHNEYLNFAATTGFVGLGAYLFMIGSFLFWSIKQIFNFKFLILNQNASVKFLNIKNSSFKNSFQISNFKFQIIIALLSSYFSILVTNFFGFSVVPVAVYFYLIPGMSFIISGVAEPDTKEHEYEHELTRIQWGVIIFILFAIFYLLFTIAKFWYADTRFNRAYQFARAGYYKQAYKPYHQAINLNPGEPFYRDELSYTAAILAVAAWEQKQASLAAQLTNEALYQSKIALTTSPANVSFWKTATKVFYTLSPIDEKYNEQALEALLTAQKLAPTDAKISYNLGLLYGRLGNAKMAIKTLEDTIALKPNYQDARYALALYYNEAGKKQEAIAQLKYILEKISTQAAEAKERLREWTGQ